MIHTKATTTILFLISFSVSSSYAQEQSNVATRIESTKADVVSPLVDENSVAGSAKLNSLTYKAAAALYPVRIESINEFKIKPLLHGYEYALAPGTYTLEVKPDFSLLKDLKPFMNTPFVIKRIEVTVTGNKRYSIGARINPDQLNDWQVQLFDVQATVASN